MGIVAGSTRRLIPGSARYRNRLAYVSCRPRPLQNCHTALLASGAVTRIANVACSIRVPNTMGKHDAGKRWRESAGMSGARRRLRAARAGGAQSNVSTRFDRDGKMLAAASPQLSDFRLAAIVVARATFRSLAAAQGGIPAFVEAPARSYVGTRGAGKAVGKNPRSQRRFTPPDHTTAATRPRSLPLATGHLQCTYRN
jgi:hypothetical protein